MTSEQGFSFHDRIVGKLTRHLLGLIFLLLPQAATAQSSYFNETDQEIRLKADEARRQGLDQVPEIRDAVMHYRNEQLEGLFVRDGLQGTLSHTPLTVRQVRLRELTYPLKASDSRGKVEDAKKVMESLRAGLGQSALSSLSIPEGVRMEQERWVNVMDLTPEEASAVASLKVGESSPVITSSAGVHIIQLLEGPVNADLHEADDLQADMKGLEAYLASLEKSGAYKVEKTALEHVRTGTSGKGEVLLRLRDKAYTVEDFEPFRKAWPLSLDRQVAYFAASCLMRQESDRLSDDPAYLALESSLEDRWLSEAITRKEILEPTLTDQEGLQAYFESHKKDYWYPEPAYEGIVVHTRTKKMASEIKKLLKKLPQKEWEHAVGLLFGEETDDVTCKAGTFFQGDDPYVDREAFKGGKVKAKEGYAAFLVMGRKVRGPEDVEPIRQQVLEDYRFSLNREWVQRLRRQADKN